MRHAALFSLLTLCLAFSGDAQSSAQAVREPQIAHMVYFKLIDNSESAIKAIMNDCNILLNDLAGTVYYSAGTLAKDFQRDINDRDWDVALHVVFKTKADHDRYQDHRRHKQFVTAHSANIKKIRVFDALVAAK